MVATIIQPTRIHANKLDCSKSTLQAEKTTIKHLRFAHLSLLHADKFFGKEFIVLGQMCAQDFMQDFTIICCVLFSLFACWHLFGNYAHVFVGLSSVRLFLAVAFVEWSNNNKKHVHQCRTVSAGAIFRSTGRFSLPKNRHVVRWITCSTAGFVHRQIRALALGRAPLSTWITTYDDIANDNM